MNEEEKRSGGYETRFAEPALDVDLARIGIDVEEPKWRAQMIESLQQRPGEGDFWRWGKELYTAMRPEVDADQAEVSWVALHRFVTSYIWLEPKFRKALWIPCWIMHPEAVELVVMLYLGRKYYEEHRLAKGGGGAREHLEFLDLRDRVCEGITEALHGCGIKGGQKAGGEVVPLWVDHVGGIDWLLARLRRVEEWEGLELPGSPEVDVARPAAKMAAEAILAAEIDDLIGGPEG